MNKKYLTKLAEEDHSQLNEIIAQGQTKARVNTRARILLKADQGWNDEQIAQALEISTATVQRTRQRYSQGGLTLALYDKARSGAPAKFEGQTQAHIIATTCTPAPGGKVRWTLRMLAEKTIELGLVESISHESVRQILILKKTSSSPGASSTGVSHKWMDAM